MAKLNIQHRSKIEKFLGMDSGFVADFSNNSFCTFIGDVTGLDVEDEKYNLGSNSKANRLRQFIKIENDSTVGKLLEEMVSYFFKKLNEKQLTGWDKLSTEDFKEKTKLYEECLVITQNMQGNIVDDIDAIKPNSNDLNFQKISDSINKLLNDNLPDEALDRLHTFLVKYVRVLCDRHQIPYKKEETLNGIFGRYVNFIRTNAHLESKMTIEILKGTIKILDAFNDVRNNRSFAHDNPILNYDESVLIFRNISSTVKFIETVEIQIAKASFVKPAVSSKSSNPFEAL